MDSLQVRLLTLALLVVSQHHMAEALVSNKPATGPTLRQAASPAAARELQKANELEQILMAYPGVKPENRERMLKALELVKSNLGKLELVKSVSYQAADATGGIMDIITNSLKNHEVKIQLDQAKGITDVLSKVSGGTKDIMELISKSTKTVGGVAKFLGPVGAVLGPLLDIVSSLIAVFVPDPDPVGKILTAIIERNRGKEHLEDIHGAIEDIKDAQTAFTIAHGKYLTNWVDRDSVTSANALYKATPLIGRLHTYIREGAADWNAAEEKLRIADLAAAVRTLSEFLRLQYYSLSLFQGGQVANETTLALIESARESDRTYFEEVFLFGQHNDMAKTLIAAAYQPDKHVNIAARMDAIDLKNPHIEALRQCLFEGGPGVNYEIWSLEQEGLRHAYRWKYIFRGMFLVQESSGNTQFRLMPTATNIGNLTIYATISWMYPNYPGHAAYVSPHDRNGLKVQFEPYAWKILPLRGQQTAIMLIDQTTNKLVYASKDSHVYEYDPTATFYYNRQFWQIRKASSKSVCPPVYCETGKSCVTNEQIIIE